MSRSRDNIGPPPAVGRGPGGDHRERRLRVSVLATGAAVLAAGVALAVSHLPGPGGAAKSQGTTSSSTARSTPGAGSAATTATTATTNPATANGGGDAPVTTTTNPTTTGAPPATAPTGTVQSAPPHGTGVTSTTASPAPSAGGPPAIMSLSPATGGPGTPVTITGYGFLSADGSIVAYVDGQVAPTSCPDQTTCTVTVPSLPGAAGSVTVTVTTDAGTSAPATFSYG